MVKESTNALSSTRGFRLVFVLLIVQSWLGASLRSDERDVSTFSIPLESPVLKTIDAITVPSQVAGVLDELLVKEGSIVKRGDRLGRLSDRAMQSELAKANLSILLAKQKYDDTTDLKLAEKSSLVAKNEFDRAVDANRRVKDVYPENEMDRLKLLFDRAILEIEKAEARRNIAKTEWEIAVQEGKSIEGALERHSIVAPRDGMIVGIEKRAGEWCDSGTAVVKLVQTDLLRVEGLVSSSDAARLTVGMKANVTVDLSKDHIIPSTANLVFISPDAIPVSGQVRVFLEMLVNDKRIRPGLRPSVQFILQESTP